VARNPSRKRKLFKQLLQALFALRDVGIELAVGAFQIRIGNHSRAPVTRTSQINNIQIVVLNQAIEMRVNKIQPWSSPKMSSSRGLTCSSFSGSRSSGLA